MGSGLAAAGSVGALPGVPRASKPLEGDLQLLEVGAGGLEGGQLVGGYAALAPEAESYAAGEQRFEVADGLEAFDDATAVVFPVLLALDAADYGRD